MKFLQSVFWLGLKEIASLRQDKVMLFLMTFAFTVFIYVPAKETGLEMRNAAVAVVDEDNSPLSRQIISSLLPPHFQNPHFITFNDIDKTMNQGIYTFVLLIPSKFSQKLAHGLEESVQVYIDATAMSQAVIGLDYIQNIITNEVTQFFNQEDSTNPLINLNIRIRFNENLYSSWFMAVNQYINVIGMLAIVLTGAALIREREHGTIEHLLVMPLTPAEIMLAKIWSNGLVIVLASLISLKLVIGEALAIPVRGEIGLFIIGTCSYLFAVTSLGIFLGTVANSMPQLGLLFLPIVVVMNVLSGGITPLDNMPSAIQYLMKIFPSTHFVEFSSAVLFRQADVAIVWQPLLTIIAIGIVFFSVSLQRLRKTVGKNLS
ncbi:ABC-2 transporter permease [Zooshikella ganghwensis]|uniref:ABC transporter permease n=1 Tax=Zooshikella ganghwensis TaxID=202772 RepID=A0A4P9VVY7_9GAMM|nr:ABC transporter permease [Zooshikella ganghwensis]RDH46542.1 ABC transporter permease [Zooshikella ganghwensis]